jgi:hypothetical protein
MGQNHRQEATIERASVLLCLRAASRISVLIRCRSFHAFDDEHVDRRRGGFELQPQLLFERGED